MSGLTPDGRGQDMGGGCGGAAGRYCPLSAYAPTTASPLSAYAPTTASAICLRPRYCVPAICLRARFALSDSDMRYAATVLAADPRSVYRKT
eukprot:1677111-Rhodomonas_salina.1